MRALTLAVSIFTAQPAMALTIDFAGTFTEDDDYQLFEFTIAAPTTVNITTTSFVAGGFVPWLHVWDSTGVAASASAPEMPDFADAVFNVIALSAGTYYASVSQWHNRAPDDVAGAPGSFTALFSPDQFSQYGNGNYTAGEAGCTGETGPFWNTNCTSPRIGAWALTILGVDSASLYPSTSTNVPEPSTWALALAGLAGFYPRLRSRKADRQ